MPPAREEGEQRIKHEEGAGGRKLPLWYRSVCGILDCMADGHARLSCLIPCHINSKGCRLYGNGTEWRQQSPYQPKAQTLGLAESYYFHKTTRGEGASEALLLVVEERLL